MHHPDPEQGRTGRRFVSTVYATVQHLDWNERGRGRLQSLDDRGPAYGVGYLLETRRIQLRAEILGGDLDLDAHSPDGSVRVIGDTDYFMLDLFADFSVLPTPSGDERRTWDLFCGGGGRLWRRDLRDGLIQDWYSLTTHIGGEYSHTYGFNRRLFVRGRIGATLFSSAYLSSPGFFFSRDTLADVNPRPGPLARLDIGLEHGRLHVGAFLDWTSYGESNTDNGFNQPDSSMTRIGLNVGFRW